MSSDNQGRWMPVAGDRVVSDAEQGVVVRVIHDDPFPFHVHWDGDDVNEVYSHRLCELKPEPATDT